jgi:hypothetical protein
MKNFYGRKEAPQTGNDVINRKPDSKMLSVISPHALVVNP